MAQQQRTGVIEGWLGTQSLPNDLTGLSSDEINRIIIRMAKMTNGKKEAKGFINLILQRKCVTNNDFYFG